MGAFLGTLGSCGLLEADGAVRSPRTPSEIVCLSLHLIHENIEVEDNLESSFFYRNMSFFLQKFSLMMCVLREPGKISVV